LGTIGAVVIDYDRFKRHVPVVSLPSHVTVLSVIITGKGQELEGSDIPKEALFRVFIAK
jgi:hypothetical protein